jgi:hypothetical protein
MSRVIRAVRLNDTDTDMPHRRNLGALRSDYDLVCAFCAWPVILLDADGDREIKAGVMGKSALSSVSHWLTIPAQHAAGKHIIDSFPGLEDKLSIEDYLRERNDMQEARFRAVEPMAGAVELVSKLASHRVSLKTGLLMLLHRKRRVYRSLWRLVPTSKTSS